MADANRPPVRALLFTDPGCPWGYSARPALARLAWRFGDQIEWRLAMIGLAERPEDYAARGFTPARMARSLRDFRRFGMPLGLVVKPYVPATSRACRAVIAAREVSLAHADAALRALQLMQFTTAGLLDDDRDLRRALEGIDGLDAEEIVARIDDPEVIAAYEADRALARSAEGTPAQAQGRHAESDGTVRYTAPSVIFEHRDGGRLEVAGFQPFEVYDTALANLDPTLRRHRPPAGALEVLERFPHGLTTAEIAAVMRRSDAEADDRAATERELIELAAAGRVAGRPVGGDALWSLPRAGAPGERCEREGVRMAA